MRLLDFVFGRTDKSTMRRVNGSSPRIEGLESREMLDASAMLTDGMLLILGSNHGDRIEVSQEAEHIVVNANGQEIQRVDGAQVQSIRIEAGDGADHITIAPAVTQPAWIDSGDGDDTVEAGSGDSTIYGGQGNDVIVGGAGADLIFGVAGRNRIDGGAGHDSIYGGSGDDKIFGGAGHDLIFGGGGRNLIHGGFGNDAIYGSGFGDLNSQGAVTAQGGDLSLDAAGGGNESDPSARTPRSEDKIDGGPGRNNLYPTPGSVHAMTLNNQAPGIDISDPANLAQIGFDGVEAVETLAAAEVQTILDRASAATASNDAIIVVVDRNGRILGVRVEDGVSPTILNDPNLLTFAIDGALAKARTGAFFANGGAPLTSRTIQFISQTTMLERSVNSNPNIPDVNSPLRGPGFVAPIGVNGHFPPVPQTPSANLFAIEHTNRDSLFHPGADGIKGNGNDVALNNRFNIDTLAPGAALFAPESSGDHEVFQGRGIATIPGGTGIYKDLQVVGGIGVFFPGETGFATEENSVLSEDHDPTLPDRSLEAEFIAFAAVGGSTLGGAKIDAIGNAPALSPSFDLPFGRIDVDGIKVPIFGPLVGGIESLVNHGANLGTGVINGANATYRDENNAPTNATRDGITVSTGWIVNPTGSAVDPLLTADVVEDIITQGVIQAVNTRAAIRLRISSDGAPTDARDLRPNASAAMTFAISDSAGNILGLYRMPDSTIFSIDVAVAKARNTAYYANPNAIDPLDLPDDDNNGVPDVDPGTAFTNRTFRYLALPYFPSGIDGTQPGDFSILNTGQTASTFTALNDGAALPAAAFDDSVMGRDAFRPGTNFRNDDAAANGLTNGIVFFPGSVPVYFDSTGDGRTDLLVGGFGVSGDGVDQDDVVTFSGSQGFQTPQELRADMQQVRNIRLPYQKFNRNPSHLEK